MMTKIVPITVDNLELLAKAGSQFGMPRSVGWFRRCLFDPTLDGLVTDSIRGHLSINEKGEVVGVQAYYYVPCYFKQERILGNTGCIMGVDHECGEELLCILDRNRETSQKGAVGFGNAIANKRSAKINKVVSRLQEAPYRPFEVRVAVADCAVYPLTVLTRVHAPTVIQNTVWLMCRPLAWIIFCLKHLTGFRGTYKLDCQTSFQTPAWEEFWQRFLAANTGVISSRAPARLTWLFEEAIHAGKVHLLVAIKDGRIDGYALIREMVGSGWAKVFEVIDISAVGNNTVCLKELAFGVVHLASKHHGIKVLFSGHMPNQEVWLDDVFTICRQADHPYFMYNSRIPEIKESLSRNEGWFFGPFDGERCLGHGGYIDL